MRTAIAQGALGGASGAGCMNVLRLLARRAGWIDLMPPQATRQWLQARAGVGPDATGAALLLDGVVHWAVGVAGGAVYGALVRRAPGASLGGGALFGLGVWALAFGVMAPALRITPSPRRTAWPANAVNVAAHLVYGVCTAFVTAELGRQAQAPGVARRWLRARVG